LLAHIYDIKQKLARTHLSMSWVKFERPVSVFIGYKLARRL